MHNLSLGIDIGGTFTDLVLYDSDTGKRHSHKELTTHDAPSRGVLEGLDKLLIAAGVKGSEVCRVVHATTLFTNALLERRGANTGLITTSGFRDILEIGRERRYELFDLDIRRPAPLVPRHLRREVRERVDAQGVVEVALNPEDVVVEARALAAQGVTSLAIAFVNAYLNPVHEEDAARAVRAALPTMVVTASCEVAPVVREDERVSTAVANAYVKPLASTYLDKLVKGLESRGVGAPLLLMLSDGGLTARENVIEAPIKAVESGPAAGVIAAAAFGAEAGESDLLAFDMGGTTAKLCLVAGGKPSRSKVFEAARSKRFMKGSGLPISTPTVELIEIGAGGGSIACANSMGLLKVGPDSAGSMPGPACFGLGGTAPTVTDANFVLGYLHPSTFAGGTLPIKVELGRQAVVSLAKQLDMSVDRTAWGIVDVVNETMARAASVHIAEHGRDPRHFVLAATGGGGPLHACQVARKLGVSRILCPSGAGVASAIGLLRAPASVTEVRSTLQSFDTIDWAALDSTFAAMEARALALLERTGVRASDAKSVRSCDLRFAGQSSETTVHLPPGPHVRNQTAPKVLEQFSEAYRARYAREPRSHGIELAGIQVECSAEAAPWKAHAAARPISTDKSGTETWRDVYFPECDGQVRTRIYRRDELIPGVSYEGPAVIEDSTSTIVASPTCCFSRDVSDHLLIFLHGEQTNA